MALSVEGYVVSSEHFLMPPLLNGTIQVGVHGARPGSRGRFFRVTSKVNLNNQTISIGAMILAFVCRELPRGPR